MSQTELCEDPKNKCRWGHKYDKWYFGTGLQLRLCKRCGLKKVFF